MSAQDETNLNALEFARQIIDGPSGFNVMEMREQVVFPYGDRLAVAVWTMKCLANANCEGSQVAIDAILAKRAA